MFLLSVDPLFLRQVVLVVMLVLIGGFALFFIVSTVINTLKQRKYNNEELPDLLEGDSSTPTSEEESPVSLFALDEDNVNTTNIS